MKKILLPLLALYLCSGAFTTLPAQDTAQTAAKPGVVPSPQPKSAALPSPTNSAANPAKTKAAGHYPIHVITGNDMTVLIPASSNPTIDGKPLAKGDEIAVFTPDGECLWSTKWKGPGKNAVLNVWGLDPQNSKTGGIRIGDSMRYRVWDSARRIEAKAAVTYSTTGMLGPTGQVIFRPTSGGVYVVNGISVLASLTATSVPSTPIRLLSPGDSATVAADSAAFLWTAGVSGTDRYIVEAAGDSTLAAPVFSDTLVDTAATCVGKLRPGMTYWYRVKGHIGASWSECTRAKPFITAR